ncbi:MAG: hypothetical protein IJJ33_19870 [Victivallales bacterium]|nr:hypothetical protein [Victivallales bacterium]
MTFTPPTQACSGCGGHLVFDPDAGMLKCRSCGNTLEFPTTEQPPKRHLFEQDYATDSCAEETRLEVQCPGCGGHIDMEPNLFAENCPYCEAPLIALEANTRQHKPVAVLPFAVTTERARALYQDWLKGRWFLPGAVKKEYVTHPLQGRYMPFWDYDAEADTDYTGERGEYYYVNVEYTTTENGKQVTRTRKERRTRWYPASGRVFNRFTDLLIAASDSLPKDLQDELEPWGLENLTGYAAEYLRGFQAETYSRDAGQCFEEAKEKAEPVIRRTVERDIGGDEQKVHGMNPVFHDVAFQPLLLPLYLSMMQWNGKQYRFLVNARTGEVQGERPWSAVKITFFVLFWLAVLAGVIWFFTQSK